VQLINHLVVGLLVMKSVARCHLPTSPSCFLLSTDYLLLPT